MRKVFLLKIYIEEVRAFIAKQKTKRTPRKSKEINALTEPDQIQEKTGVGEIGRKVWHEGSEKGSCWKDQKRGEIGNQRRIRQLPITVVIIRAEVVKALQTRSPPHA